MHSAPSESDQQKPKLKNKCEFGGADVTARLGTYQVAAVVLVVAPVAAALIKIVMAVVIVVVVIDLVTVIVVGVTNLAHVPT